MAGSTMPCRRWWNVPHFADLINQIPKGYDDLAGGFLWDFSGIGSNTAPCSGKIPALSDYVNAIISGLSHTCS